MIRTLALVWLVVVALAGGYLGWRVHAGLSFRTDLMALLPREERNPAIQRANDIVARAFSQRILLLVGAPERAAARDAAARLSATLEQSGLAEIVADGFDKDRLQRLGSLYYPYRRGLLADSDRRLLAAGKGQEVATQALAQVYGFVGMADAGLVRRDPFLLMPRFFSQLPLPMSRLSLDDGRLSLTDEGKTWVLVAARLKGEPYALATQAALTSALDPAIDAAAAAHPGLSVLRLGAVFYAKAGAEQAMGETSTIGLVSTLGTVLLVLAAFRALAPLWSSLLVIGTGVVTALAASLWMFGELHVGALLFGVTLIGVAVDYSLQYCTEVFAPPGPRPSGAAGMAPPRARLKRVLAGVSLGTATTVIGYLTLLLAPFPGLHQVAAFSVVGLVAAWLTVVLWLPSLDRARPPRHGRRMLAAAQGLLTFWQADRTRGWRLAALALAVAVAAGGLARLHPEDDVRRMQGLSPPLRAQQEHLQRLIGFSGDSQFFLVEAADAEQALEREEALVDRLKPLVAQGALGGFQAAAQYVPSAARQAENRALVAAGLDPLLAAQTGALGLAEPPPAADDHAPPLTLKTASENGGALGLLSNLILEDQPGYTAHAVMLQGIARLDAVAAAARGLDGVRLVDPTGDFSRLLGEYRERAIALLALSALLMAPLLIWRYGLKAGLRTMLPPSLAVVLAPAIAALAGAPFTFFDAMGLVLVLSIGVDYAVFCAESQGERRPVTMLAVALAAASALLSFGLLALSGVAAVHAFGTTMLIGILLSFLLAPLAQRPAPAALPAGSIEAREASPSEIAR